MGAGHAIGSICLICVGSLLFLPMSIFFLPMGIAGLLLAAIIAGLIGSAIAESWWEGMIEGFFVGFPYLLIFGGATYLLKSVVDTIGNSVSNSLMNNLSGMLSQGLLYIILIYAIAPMVSGALVGYLKGRGGERKARTESPPSYYQPDTYSESSPFSYNTPSKSRIMKIIEEIDGLKEEKKKLNIQIETLKEMRGRISEDETTQWKIDEIDKKLEMHTHNLEEVNFKLDENEILLRKIINDYLPPLCEEDGFPLRLVRSGNKYVWHCDLCNSYKEEWKDWKKISDMPLKEKNEKKSALMKAYNKINKFYNKGKINYERYEQMKNIITNEINKLRGENVTNIYLNPVSPLSEKDSESFEILPDKIRISCPYCGFESDIPPSMIGKRLKCPQCGNVFTATAEGAKNDDAKNKENSDFRDNSEEMKK